MQGLGSTIQGFGGGFLYLCGTYLGFKGVQNSKVRGAVLVQKQVYNVYVTSVVVCSYIQKPAYYSYSRLLVGGRSTQCISL